jgi:DNA processing protein
VIPYCDPTYPHFLREISDPPIVLYCMGKIPDWNTRFCVSMVGTRKMSAYGLHSSYKIAYGLAASNALVISGMATGIDGVCSAAALAAGGETVAVLGCGVDVVYPKHHKPLRDAICKNGAVISEYPPGTAPRGYHFPERNRIISGMSQATVVLEAGVGSGSLITANTAVLQGRALYALPANVGSRGAEGTNNLLLNGALPITSAVDILERYRHVYSKHLNLDGAMSLGDKANTDLHFLQRLGVIELTERATEKAAKEQPPKSASRRSEEKDKASKEKQKPHGENKPEKKKAEALPKKSADETFSSLDPVSQAVLKAMPDDTAICADSLCVEEYSHGEIVASLTILEIGGLVQKLPGAMYVKL